MINENRPRQQFLWPRSVWLQSLEALVPACLVFRHINIASWQRTCRDYHLSVWMKGGGSNAYSFSLEFCNSAGCLDNKYTALQHIYLQICESSGLWECEHAHASRRRKSLFNAPQGSTWDKIQQLWIIQSIYQGKSANPDMRTHTTHIYSTQRVVVEWRCPCVRGRLSECVIQSAMAGEAWWSELQFLLIALNRTACNATLLCPCKVKHPLSSVWICISQPQKALLQEKCHHSRTRRQISKSTIFYLNNAEKNVWSNFTF